MTHPEASCRSVACRREMFRSVSRTVFSSPRPIEYSSRTSGSGVRLPSSSSIVSFHIPRRLTKPGARSSQDSTIRSVYRSPTQKCNEAFCPSARDPYRPCRACSPPKAKCTSRLSSRPSAEDLRKTYLVASRRLTAENFGKPWLSRVAWAMTGKLPGSGYEPGFLFRLVSIAARCACR